jgi:3',5'-cyclic AMP phosphodiesterase CpdA
MLPLPNDLGWYAVTLGPMRLVVLDTNLPCGDRSEQGIWLRQETAGPPWRDATFRMIAFHHPPFSVMWDEAGYDGEATVRSDIVPVIEERGVHLVLSGHAHAYEHFRRKRADGGSVEYLVLGGGGGALDGVQSAEWPGLVNAVSRHHIAVVEVSPQRVGIRVIDTASGEVIDDVSVGE